MRADVLLRIVRERILVRVRVLELMRDEYELCELLTAIRYPK